MRARDFVDDVDLVVELVVQSEIPCLLYLLIL